MLPDKVCLWFVQIAKISTGKLLVDHGQACQFGSPYVLTDQTSLVAGKPVQRVSLLLLTRTKVYFTNHFEIL